MVFDFMFFKMMVNEIEEMANNEKGMKEFIYTGGIRACGYYEECEQKYEKRYPKTFKRYREAQQQWFTMFDKCFPKVEEIRKKDRAREEQDIKKRLEKAEKEIAELRKKIK